MSASRNPKRYMNDRAQNVKSDLIFIFVHGSKVNIRIAENAAKPHIAEKGIIYADKELNSYGKEAECIKKASIVAKDIKDFITTHGRLPLVDILMDFNLGSSGENIDCVPLFIDMIKDRLAETNKDDFIGNVNVYVCGTGDSVTDPMTTTNMKSHYNSFQDYIKPKTRSKSAVISCLPPLLGNRSITGVEVNKTPPKLSSEVAPDFGTTNQGLLENSKHAVPPKERACSCIEISSMVSSFFTNSLSTSPDSASPEPITMSSIMPSW